MQTTTQVAVDPGKVAVDPGKGASGIEAYVLDADALLAFI